MNTVFNPAPDAKIVAERIVLTYNEHEHLRDLFKKDLITFYFRSDNTNYAGKCKKATEFERALTGKIFLIFINQLWWERSSREQQHALIDHELCHIGRKNDEPEYFKETDTIGRWNKADDPASWFIIDHDVEEFAGVIERHGLWERGIEKIADACAIHERQMTLGEFVEKEDDFSETSSETISKYQ